MSIRGNVLIGLVGTTMLAVCDISLVPRTALVQVKDADTDGDTDGDTVGDSDGDTVGDSDGDTVGNSDGDTLGNSDGDTLGNSDGDTVGDSDGDTVGDSDGTDGDTVGDTDGDTVGDACDNCPDGANPDPGDKDGNEDGNGEGDVYEPIEPSCFDGLANGEETDFDCGGATCGPCGLGSACVVNRDCASQSCQQSLCQPAACIVGDADGDGICDAIDNCLDCYNPGQADADGDGLGECWRCDRCDGPGSDADSDGICDGVDNCVNSWNASQADHDRDGIGDMCDPVDDPLPDHELTPCDVGDADADGICDDVDTCVFCDPCAEPWGAMVTFGFDDSYGSHYELAAPALEERGFRATFYTIVRTTALGGREFMNVDYLRAMARSGHEVGSHTYNHLNLPTLTTEEIDYELGESKAWIEDIIGQEVESFATPMGAFDDRVLATARLYYGNHRAVRVGMNFPGDDPYMLKGNSMVYDAPPSQAMVLIDNAIARNGWVQIYFHDLTETYNGWSYEIDNFVEILDFAVETGVEVITVRDAVARMQCP